jgi:hypothetical protein
MVMWFVIFLAGLLVLALVAVSQAPGSGRERAPARPKAARPATARPRPARTAPPAWGGAPAQSGLPVRGTTQARDVPQAARHAMPSARGPGTCGARQGPCSSLRSRRRP